MDMLVIKKLNEIYKLIMDFNDFNINIHLIWVKAHNNEERNECADDLAKIGMFNIYQTKKWKFVKRNYNQKDWTNYSLQAIKKENKRNAFYRTIKKWESIKLEKKK